VQAASRNDGPESLSAIEQDIPGITSALRRDPLARPAPEALVRNLEGLALDRNALAEMAAQAELSESEPVPLRAAARPSPKALTPTAPMVAKQPKPAAELSAADGAQAQAPRPGLSGLRAVVVVFAAIGLLATGFLVGRFAPRGGQTSLAIEGPLPRRAQVELDGRALMVSEGAKMPIAAGRHVLAITQPRGEKREYTFTVRPGEQFVLMPLARQPSNSNRDAAEEREP
jgi:serine/threonine-protein kinase